MIGASYTWIAPNMDHVPAELKEGEYHVCWAYEPAPGNTVPTKLPKVALQVGSRQASSTNQTTWRPLDAALKAYATGRYAGVGRVITPPYVGIDGDDCRDPVTGELDERGRRIVESLDGYAEVSPSGTGVKVWVRDEEGRVGRAFKKVGLEIYPASSARYFALTGAAISEVPESIPERGAELEALIAREFPEPKKPPTEHRNGNSGDDLDDLLAEWGVPVAKAAPDGSADKKYAITCPWVREHTGGDDSGTFVGQYPDGAKFFYCHHAHCAGRDFKAFAHAVMPPPKYVNVTMNGHKAAHEPPGAQTDRHFPCTDLGNSARFVAAHGSDVRWCTEAGRWMIWDGTVWRWDEGAHATHRLAHRCVRGIFREAENAADNREAKAIATHAVASQSASRIEALLSQAKPYLNISMDDLDRDVWLVNASNGTLDLRTGELREHRREDLITKSVPFEYDPEARAPRFIEFMKQVLPDPEVRAFVQRYAGYSLSGSTAERVLAFLHGGGKNGKSTLVEALREAAGDYARNTTVETILSSRGGSQIPNDVAALKGARLVSAAEPEKNRRMAESKVKNLTGSDTVTARFMRGEFFDFKPEFKLWISMNHKPIIVGTDDAIWDRIRLVPFNQRFADNPDTGLPAKLAEERAGIFAWMVRGALDWHENGLGCPKAVEAATAEYREDMDTLGDFLEARCVVEPNATAVATALYKQYEMWCSDAGETPDSQRAFGLRLSERGFESFKFTGGPNKDRKGWRGVGIRADDGGPDQQPNKDGGDDKPPEDASQGPPSGSGADKGPLGKNGAFAGETPETADKADDSGQRITINEQNHTHEAAKPKTYPLSSASSAPASAAVNNGLRADRPDVPNSYLVRAEDGAVSVEQTKIRGQVYRLFQNPPAWLPIQVGEYAEHPEERLVRPLCASVAHTLGYPPNAVPDDVRLQVERELEAECDARSAA